MLVGKVEGSPLPAGCMFPSGSLGVVVWTKGTDCDLSVTFVVPGGGGAWSRVTFLGLGLLFGLEACVPEAPGPCAFGLVFGTV